MNVKMRAKIAKGGKYLTSSDDVRLDMRTTETGHVWEIGGFAHNPDGQDIKGGSFVQGGDHYGHVAGERMGCKLLDTPQFFGLKTWETLDAARADIREGVPLVSKWGFPAEHFGPHVPITFAFLGREGLGECVLYDIQDVRVSW
jgi:hypothetical protein